MIKNVMQRDQNRVIIKIELNTLSQFQHTKIKISEA